MTRTVPFARGTVVTYRVLVRQLVTTGRLAALGLLGAGVVLVGWAVGRSGDRTGAEQLDVALETMSQLAFTTVLPIVSLVFAAASLGDPRDDGTLVYLWLRPMSRLSIVMGAWLAALTAALPLTVVPSVAMAAFFDAGSDLVVASAIASVIGVLAYTALFVFLGLLVRNGIVWGLVYVLVWEGFVALLGSSAARVAIRGYTSAILEARTGGALAVAASSEFVGIIVPLCVVVVALWLSSVRLQSLEVD